VVTAPPALVGSAPAVVPPPAVASMSGAEDNAAEQATQPAVSTVLAAYASGQLAYVRSAGSGYAGLAGIASLGSLILWRVAPLGPGADPDVRTGDATVTWHLAGGGATLTCSYRLVLQQQAGRWLLAQITPEITVVT